MKTNRNKFLIKNQANVLLGPFLPWDGDSASASADSSAAAAVARLTVAGDGADPQETTSSLNETAAESHKAGNTGSSQALAYAHPL